MEQLIILVHVGLFCRFQPLVHGGVKKKSWEKPHLGKCESQPAGPVYNNMARFGHFVLHSLICNLFVIS